MAAGITTLWALAQSAVFDEIATKAERLEAGIVQSAVRHRIPVRVNRVGSMFTAFFTEAPVTDYADARRADAQRYARFFHALLEAGVYFPPSQFEAAFTSAAHTDADLDATLAAIDAAMAAVTG
jgi:glutamate-1-semialdehyde 2,1-aminomutase